MLFFYEFFGFFFWQNHYVHFVFWWLFWRHKKQKNVRNLNIFWTNAKKPHMFLLRNFSTQWILKEGDSRYEDSFLSTRNNLETSFRHLKVRNGWLKDVLSLLGVDFISIYKHCFRLTSYFSIPKFSYSDGQKSTEICLYYTSSASTKIVGTILIHAECL